MTRSEQIEQTDLAFVFSLPPLLTHIFKMLLEQSRVTTEQLTNQLPEGTDVKSAMFRLRRFLKSHEVELKSRRYLGYWVDPADKTKLLELARITQEGNV